MKTDRHIHTSEFDLYFHGDTVLVLPPSRFMLALARAQMNGTISARAAKFFLRSWLNRFTLALISCKALT